MGEEEVIKFSPLQGKVRGRKMHFWGAMLRRCGVILVNFIETNLLNSILPPYIRYIFILRDHLSMYLCTKNANL